MKRSQEKEILRLTQECLCHYWRLDLEYVFGYFDENISFIGSEQTQFILGIENVKQDFLDIFNHLRSCYLLHQEFYIAQSSGKVCTVIGKYLVTTDDKNDYFLQVQQRCTFVWEIKNEQFRIIHIHISNPMGELKIAEGERFVNSLGYMANQYLQERFESKLPDKQIIITDEKGSIRTVHLSEILYVMANHNDLIITAMDDKVHAKLSMTEFMKMAGKQFLKIHRSYAVNLNYMSKLERYSVTMSNGDQLPVPVKKYSQLKARVMQIHNSRISGELID